MKSATSLWPSAALAILLAAAPAWAEPASRAAALAPSPAPVAAVAATPPLAGPDDAAGVFGGATKNPRADPLADPAVTPRTLAATVCVPRYTRRVRASSQWLRALKRERLAAIGLGPEHARAYQLDHKLPLILGGAADDAANLELQPMAEAQRKDRIERKLGCFVCNGQMSLDEARLWILGDWREAYHAWAPVKCRRPGRRA